MLNVSIVLYRHAAIAIKPIVDALRRSSLVEEVYLIDNSPEPDVGLEQLVGVRYLFMGKNVGYGAGHNIAMRQTMAAKVKYHLVLNPDVEWSGDVLGELAGYMEQNPDVGHLMPRIIYPTGRTQYLCKLLPTPADLFVRRFLPAKWSERTNVRFELRASGYDKTMEVPYLSGCFMLLRTSALEDVGLFDERFFMYPEDIDLTRRIHRRYKTVFYPYVEVVHHHEQASYRSRKLLFVHLWNLIKYFNKWGWFFDAERKAVNKKILSQITAGKVSATIRA